jgi:hypothetical protein
VSSKTHGIQDPSPPKRAQWSTFVSFNFICPAQLAARPASGARSTPMKGAVFDDGAGHT